MRTLALTAVIACVLCADNTFANPPHHGTNVSVGPAGVSVQTGGVFGLHRHSVNLTANPAYVNSQLLVDPNFRRAQLSDVNSFTYAPVNSPANLRFRHHGVHLIQQVPVTSAPIIEQYQTQLPAQVIQQVGALEQGSCQPAVTTTQVPATDPNYLTQPAAEVQPQTGGFSYGARAITRPQTGVYMYGVRAAPLAVTGGCTQAITQPQRLLISTQPAYPSNRAFLAAQPAYPSNRAFLATRQSGYPVHRHFIRTGPAFISQPVRQVHVHVNHGVFGLRRGTHVHVR